VELRSCLPPSSRRFGKISYRKELKIRPGYTPDEDVSRYRSLRAAESDARAAVKGTVPGLAPSAVQAALTGMNKAQKKNVKRKEKRKEDSTEDTGATTTGEKDEVPDSWDADGEGEVSTNNAGEGDKTPNIVQAPLSTPMPAPVEDSKRVKALRKKLRQVTCSFALYIGRCSAFDSLSQAEQLREREGLGLYLPPAERAKVKGIPDLEAELSRMTLDDAEEAKA
jgi:partner of Y14 and mago protein